jgi:hypothetical protein
VKFVPNGPAVKLPVGDNVNQVAVVQFCSDTWMVASVFVWANTVSVCEAGAVPPAAAVNVYAERLKDIPGAVIPVTFKVTVAVCVTEAAVIEIVPLHVVPAASPAGFTEIVKLVFVGLAVKLPVGERISQLLPAQLSSETCAVALILVCAVTVSVCEAGVEPPAIALNVKDDALKVSTPVVIFDTFNVTGTDCVPAATVIEIVPLHVVPAVRPAGFTATVNTELVGLAVKLPVGERVSQLLPVQLCSDTCAVALVVVCDVTVSVCEAGFPPPATALNVNEDGLSERPVAVGLVTFSVTLAVCVPEATVIEIVPLHVVPAANPD